MFCRKLSTLWNRFILESCTTYYLLWLWEEIGLPVCNLVTKDPLHQASKACGNPFRAQTFIWKMKEKPSNDSPLGYPHNSQARGDCGPNHTKTHSCTSVLPHTTVIPTQLPPPLHHPFRNPLFLVPYISSSAPPIYPIQLPASIHNHPHPFTTHILYWNMVEVVIQPAIPAYPPDSPVTFLLIKSSFECAGFQCINLLAV